MGRVINPESAGKERNQLNRAVVLAIRELMKQNTVDDTSRDLAAFISLALLRISETIDTSVEAWEKRDYWIKADRFRMEWAWSGRLGHDMRQAVLAGDWAMVAMTAAQAAQKLMNVKVPIRHRLGTPWVGAWQELQKMG
ncbi:MAG: hypothetical protein EHM70_23520 [Chloroflexota bacterium]|nr:MAG: hypothetical protein EHM70_23520 [Chloroflexota bacterium]